jgi:type IV secretion system protein VirB4
MLFIAETRGKTPFKGSLHHYDVGHTLIVGDTGSGKSTLLGFLMTQHLRYPGAQAFMFDKGYSSFALCHALSGQHYDIANNDTLSFAPLQGIAYEQELDRACEWLEVLYHTQHITLSPSQRKEIRTSLMRLSTHPAITLTNLQATLQDQPLKEALEFYTLSGAMGSLLDANKDALSTSYLQVFEMEHLLNKEEKFVLPLLEYLFRQINKRLDVSKPSLIIIEEGHRFLKGHFGRQLEVWFRECRKLNTAVIFVTQGLSEILASPYKHILLNSCPTKIFLPNSQALSAYNKALYEEVGLSDSHINIISQAVPKKDYLLTSPGGTQLLDLSLQKTFLALMESASLESREKILALRDQHKAVWVYHYLIEKGYQQEAEAWIHVYKEMKK